MKERRHIVIPYRLPAENGNNGWELKITLRSLYENLDENFDITIIGDIPDWINTSEIICVELDNHSIVAQRQTKINQKILKASELYDEFLVFNDDIIVMRETDWGELCVDRRIGGDTLFKFESGKKYSENSFFRQMQESYMKLKELGFQCNRNFVSHCPHFYTSSNIRKIEKYIDLIPMGKTSVVFENVYHNFFGHHGIKAWKDRYGCWRKDCEKYNNQLFFNFDENGSNHNRWIRDFLEEKFNKKCRGEK